MIEQVFVTTSIIECTGDELHLLYIHSNTARPPILYQSV